MSDSRYQYDEPQQGDDFVTRVEARMKSVFSNVDERVQHMMGLVPHALGETKTPPRVDRMDWENTIQNHPDPEMAFERHILEIEQNLIGKGMQPQEARILALNQGYQFAKRNAKGGGNAELPVPPAPDSNIDALY